MTDQEDNILLGKIVFDDNNQERKSWASLGQNCSRSLIVFLFQPFVIFLIIFGLFCRIHLSKICDQSIVWVGNFLQCGRVHFTLTKAMNNLISTKNRVFGRSLRNWKNAAYLQLAKIGTFEPNFD